MPRAIVSGAIANKPLNGGEAWVRLSWLLGLQRLGFEVYFAEQIAAEDCVDAGGEAAEFGRSVNRSYFEQVVSEFGLAGRAGLLWEGGRESAGLDLQQLVELAAGAELLLNLSGQMRLEAILAGPRTRVYVDLDPGFTQAWHADGQVPFRLPPHDRYVTVGLNVGAPGWPVPSDGIEWVPTLPPVLLDEWPALPAPDGPPRFTTIATWRSPLGTLAIGGRELSLKHHQFRRLLELPERIDRASFEIALDIHPGDAADREALESHGWTIVDPRQVARTPRAFRDYVAGSAAEFSVAQGVYAETRSGWFSDRTAAYLACGRPALVQDTGLPAGLAASGGLRTFDSLEEAVAGAELIAAGYEAESAAAREIASRWLDSDAVIGGLLAKLGLEL